MGPETKVSGPIFACSSLSRLRRQLPLGGSLFLLVQEGLAFFVNGSQGRQNDGACYRKDFGISTVDFKTVRVCARDQSRGSTVLSDTIV